MTDPDNADDGVPSVAPANKPAAVALIAGLLSWVPGVGLVAIVAGLAGAGRARVTGGAGRGKAFLGVVLGIASLFLYAVLAGAISQGRAMQRQAPAFHATVDFVRFIGSGQVGPAKGLCTDAIDVDRLTDTAEQFQKWGALTDAIAYGGEPLGDGARVEAALPFAKSTQRLTCDWVYVDGRPRLSDYHLVEAPATPATN